MARDNNVLVAAPIEAAQRFVLTHAPWGAYESLLSAIGERSNYRITFNKGVLEIMSPSGRHEKVKYLMGCLIDAMLDEAKVKSIPSGSFTMKRPDILKGLEADQCYYIRSFRKVRGKDEVDLSVDPPPDLCVEIDVANSSVDRLSVYAGLQVPEVWRWERNTIVVYILQDDGSYKAGRESREIVPGYQPAALCRFIRFGIGNDRHTMVKRFRREFKTWLAARKKK